VVSRVISGGSGGFIGILRDDPARVLKFCSPENEYAVQGLQREKAILAILGSHQYITRLDAVWEIGLVFEYYPFGSLREYYTKLSGVLPSLHDRFRWCNQCITAVAYIHSKNVVHNDISARNVLLSSEMNIKMCDFGFSTRKGEKSPGRAETRYDRFRTDIWGETVLLDDFFAIGSLLFEILSGKRPYDDIDSTAVERRYQDHAFPSLNSIDSDYARIIDSCWNERYCSIKDIEKELSLLRPASSTARNNNEIM
jgi:serine/threonine protein kinase